MYGDAETAQAVRAALDGHLVASHLLGNIHNLPTRKIRFSQHTDLTINLHPHRSRDYTSAYLPRRFCLWTPA
ncbi:hypothetical protein WJX81_002099 [Elliptochloris bilobata]|uniref:Uncharacterized protein n=1 Tax=Elliptochloris bilobata TaxID=381761 RepID=A0AAW1RYN5_9CHLO